MSYQVIYFSRKGSTKKIAEAIASELGVNAEDVKTAKLHNDTFVFLGSGCYGGKPGKQMEKFIDLNNFTSRNVALFGTSGGGEGKETEAMKTMLKNKDANIKATYFCQGRFWFGNKDKPSKEDVEKAIQFTKNMVK